MSGATTVLHEKSPAATGSPTYGSCVFFVYPVLWLLNSRKRRLTFALFPISLHHVAISPILDYDFRG